MFEPAERFFLDLPGALTGQVEPLADLFKGVRGLFADAEIELDDLFFPLGQRIERLVDLILERNLNDAVVGQLLVIVPQKVHEFRIFAVDERRVERHVAIADFYRLPDFLFVKLELAGDLLHGGIAAVFLLQFTLGLADLVDRAGWLFCTPFYGPLRGLAPTDMSNPYDSIVCGSVDPVMSSIGSYL